MYSSSPNNLSETDLLTRIKRLEQLVLDGHTPETFDLNGSPVDQSFSGFPTRIDNGQSITIPDNTQQLVRGALTVRDGALTFGQNAELRVM